MAEPVEERHGYVVDEDVDAIEYYFERGVTDGLPVVPPTEARMARILAVTARPADEVVALVPPNYGAATIEKIAVNAVMAGCKPDYLPVVIAGVQAMCAEQVSLHGVQGTTHTATPLFIVNGPVRQQLDINCATGVFGSGWRANATIGRALRLIMTNHRRRPTGRDRQVRHGAPGEVHLSHRRVRRGKPLGAAARRKRATGPTRAPSACIAATPRSASATTAAALPKAS